MTVAELGGLPGPEAEQAPGRRARADLARSSAARVLYEHSATADMVVVGCRGHGGVVGLLLGSVSWQVAAHGQGWVVVVRGLRPAKHSLGPVVVGTDGSAAAQAAVAFAFEEAALRDVPLLAVCALADAPGILGGARRMEEDFDRSMTVWEKDHPEVPVLRQAASGTPAALLAATAKAQMLVVGSRGRGGIQGMPLGSVAHVLLHHAPCPVGIVQPPLNVGVHADLAVILAEPPRLGVVHDGACTAAAIARRVICSGASDSPAAADSCKMVMLASLSCAETG